MSSFVRRVERRIFERQGKYKRITRRVKGLTHRQVQRGIRRVNNGKD